MHNEDKDIKEITDKENDVYRTEFLLELLISRHEKRPSQLEALNEMPLYPTEDIVWDENVVQYYRLYFYARVKFCRCI